jgi:hypothetical protein
MSLLTQSPIVHQAATYSPASVVSWSSGDIPTVHVRAMDAKPFDAEHSPWADAMVARALSLDIAAL